MIANKYIKVVTIFHKMLQMEKGELTNLANQSSKVYFFFGCSIGFIFYEESSIRPPVILRITMTIFRRFHFPMARFLASSLSYRSSLNLFISSTHSRSVRGRSLQPLQRPFVQIGPLLISEIRLQIIFLAELLIKSSSFLIFS